MSARALDAPLLSIFVFVLFIIVVIHYYLVLFFYVFFKEKILASELIIHRKVFIMVQYIYDVHT